MRIVLDARARALLRRLPRPNPYSLAELVLMMAVSVQLARLTWVILTPIAPVGAWRPAVPGYAGSPRAVLASYDPFTGGPASAATVAPVGASLVRLTLFGTRIDARGGSAILAGPDGIQKSIGVGEEVAPGLVLKSVAFDHVTVDRGGVAEDVFLPKSDSGATSPPAVAPAQPLLGTAPSPATAPSTAAPTLAAAQLRSDVALSPRLDGGRLSGLIVRPQGSGAAFRAAGLQDGDVIVQIDGRPVSSPADLDRAVTGVSRGGVLGVTIERGGARLPLAITIAGQ